MPAALQSDALIVVPTLGSGLVATHSVTRPASSSAALRRYAYLNDRLFPTK